MFFALLTFLSAFFIEGIGTYISILGLSALFAFNPVIIAMAVSLDLGKVVAVSFLYKSWKDINLLMKTYMTIASIVLITITSMGVFGFLSGEFQKAIASNNTQNISITALQEEQGRLQKRKEQIDQQIATLPEKYSANQRIRMINQFKQEQKTVTDRLGQIDKELPTLKVKNIEKSVKIGPILYVAEAFGTTPEQAVKWVILTIIGVFDPMAIALILAGNYLWEKRRLKAQAVKVDESLPLTPVIPDAEAPIGSPEWNATMGEYAEPYPDASPAKVYTRDDLIAGGAPDSVLIDAGYEPRTKIHARDDIIEAGQPTEPLFEVLQPSPGVVKAEVQEEIMGDPAIVDTTSEVIPRASLENIDTRRGDVMFDDDARHSRQISSIVNQYRDDGPAISVGGPPTKI